MRVFKVQYGQTDPATPGRKLEWAATRAQAAALAEKHGGTFSEVVVPAGVPGMVAFLNSLSLS